jgi:hypothetical protein
LKTKRDKLTKQKATFIIIFIFFNQFLLYGDVGTMVNFGIPDTSNFFSYGGGGFWANADLEFIKNIFIPGFFIHGSLGLSFPDKQEKNPYGKGTIEYVRFENNKNKNSSYFHLGYGVGFYNRFRIIGINISPFIGITGATVIRNENDSEAASYGNWFTFGVIISTSTFGIQYTYGFDPINSLPIGHIHQISLFLRLKGFKNWIEENGGEAHHE